MHVLLINPAWDPPLPLEPEALAARYDTLSGWAAAMLAAGASRVTVLQRFARDAGFERDGLAWRCVADAWGPWLPSWAPARRLARRAAQAGPDLVHVNGLVFPGLLRALRPDLPRSVPIVVQDHGSRPPRGLGKWWALPRRRLWQGGLGTTVGALFTAAPQADAWRAARALPEGVAVHAVPESSRPVRPLHPATARARTALRGSPALLWVGRLREVKDPLSVLEGFRRALEALPGAVLTFVYQDDTLLAPLKARLAAAPALAARVELRGRVAPEAVPDLLSAADAFVSGSRAEGSGYALIEAIGCGATPVVTDIPSFRALAGPIGVFWPPGDPAALARALASLPDRLGDGAREAVRRRFDEALSWDAVGRRAMDVYREVLRE
jgi:glycosyltransferase involved in cell wall biosynthesis